MEKERDIKEIIPGVHTSQETAYVVDDYPYGFRLRCKMRHWIEYKEGKGFRHVSQTTNPKITNREVWNKPKLSTYFRFGLAFYLNNENHLHCAGLSEYSNYEESLSFYQTFREGLTAEGRDICLKWVDVKKKYEEKVAEGVHWTQAAGVAMKELVDSGQYSLEEILR